MRDFDVVVVGGGAAGIAAAVGAARRGSKTLLLERLSYLGGLATAGMIGTIGGLYHSESVAPPEELKNRPFRKLHNPFAHEFADALQNACSTKPVWADRGRLGILPYKIENFKNCATAITGIEENLTVWLEAVLLGAKAVGSPKHREIAAITVQTAKGLQELATSAVVDCTGDAHVAFVLGAERIPIKNQANAVIAQAYFEHMPDQTEHDTNILAIRRMIGRKAVSGEAPHHWNFVVFERLPEAPEKGLYIKLPLPNKPNTNHTIEMKRFVDFLTENMPANKAPKLDHIAPMPGRRLSHRYQGKSTLMDNHILSPPDEQQGVAEGSWPIEIWDAESCVPMLKYAEPGATYPIALGALSATNWHNLWMAGRCISAEERAIASARVIGTCMATGYAAGRAAALHTQGIAFDEIADQLHIPK